MANSIDDKIFKKELAIEKSKETIAKTKENLLIQEKDLVNLKNERDLQKLIKMKETFDNEEDVSKFIDAVGNGDIESIKLLLKKH